MAMSVNYQGVDVSATCTEYCSKVFGDPRVSFYTNNGSDLSMIDD